MLACAKGCVNVYVCTSASTLAQTISAAKPSKRVPPNVTAGKVSLRSTEQREPPQRRVSRSPTRQVEQSPTRHWLGAGIDAPCSRESCRHRSATALGASRSRPLGSGSRRLGICSVTPAADCPSPPQLCPLASRRVALQPTRLRGITASGVDLLRHDLCEEALRSAFDGGRIEHPAACFAVVSRLFSAQHQLHRVVRLFVEAIGRRLQPSCAEANATSA